MGFLACKILDCLQNTLGHNKKCDNYFRVYNFFQRVPTGVAPVFELLRRYYFENSTR